MVTYEHPDEHRSIENKFPKFNFQKKKPKVNFTQNASKVLNQSHSNQFKNPSKRNGFQMISYERINNSGKPEKVEV